MAGWVAHVDESGSGPDIRGGPGRFVLACIAGSPETITGINEKIRRLKLRLVPGLDPADWELYAADMFHNRGGSPLGSMGIERQMSVMRSIVDIVCGSDVVLFKAVVMLAHKRGKRAIKARAVRRAMGILVGQLEQIAGQKEGVTFHIVSDHVHEKHRLAMKGALERRTLGHPTKSRARGRRDGHRVCGLAVKRNPAGR